MLDMLVYGLWLAALCLASFTLVLFGFNNGWADIGEDCNNKIGNINDPNNCHVVFRARATTFASLTWFALFLAWEMVHMRRSFFRMVPGSKKYFTQWFHDVWRNQFLFWSIIGGIVTMFPILYIPGLSTVVFKHKGISWEWGIVFVESILFFLGIESWKLAKRVYFRRQAKKKGVGKNVDLEERTFGHYFTQGKPSSNGDESPNAESDAEKAAGKPASPTGAASNENGAEKEKAEV